jgi:sulfur carrier protein ThiS
VKVRLRDPDREVETDGGRTVRDPLVELGVQPDTVLVIRGGGLVTRQERRGTDDEISDEVPPVEICSGVG